MKNDYARQIITVLSENSNPANAKTMKRYLRDQFEFFGIKGPTLKKLTKPFMQKSTLPEPQDIPEIVMDLWSIPQRESQHFAIELLKKYQKLESKEWIELYEHMIVEKSWWDTVDAVAAWHVGNHFKHYPAQIEALTSKWMSSGNMWLQRTCLLFQLKYKDDTDFELMKSFIVLLADSKEFFIRKAIGWALREYSKTQPEQVMQFVSQQKLAPLSYNEATRIIQKSQSDLSH